MGAIQHLADEQAIEKLKKLATDADICLFTTQLTSLPLSTRPMSVQAVDAAGNL